MSRSSALYARVMGDSWSRLAEPLRNFHATATTIRGYGRLRVEHGRHPVARLLAQILRLPRPNVAAETRLTIAAHAGVECWERTFDDRRLRTIQRESDACQIVESFGVLEFSFHLTASAASLVYVQREAAFRCWRLRMWIPARCAPRVEAREDPAGPTRIHIQVRVTLPAIGLLISYAGIIAVETPS